MEACYALKFMSTIGMLTYKQGGSLETRTCRFAFLPQRTSLQDMYLDIRHRFGWLFSGFTSYSKAIMETGLKSRLKDWRNKELNHWPSITNLAYTINPL